MNGLEKLKAVLGSEFAQLLVDSHKEAVEDGVRMGLGMAAKTIDGTAERIGSEEQRDALRGVAAGLRELSAMFTPSDGGDS